MPALIDNPAFRVYALVAIVLCLNLYALWAYSGFVRTRSKATPNPEDVQTISPGATVAAGDPPDVARVLRAHRNAADNILPFLVLAFLYVAFGASPLSIGIFGGVFTVARLLHSWAYLAEKQPWRSIAFGVSSTAAGIMTVSLAVLVLRAP